MEKETDENAIDEVIRGFFDAFDNRERIVCDERALMELFTDKAVVAKHAEGICELYTVEEFVRPRVALLRSGDLLHFHEWEESSATQIAGDIAMRSSRYSKAGQLRGSPYAQRGTKFFHLARIADCWRIVSLVWTDDWVDNTAMHKAAPEPAVPLDRSGDHDFKQC